MLNTLSQALFHPRLMILRAKDKVGKIILYFLILILFAMIPFFIGVCSQNRFSGSVYKSINESIILNDEYFSKLKIIDNHLNCKEELFTIAETDFFDISIGNNVTTLESGFHIVLQNDGLFLYMGAKVVKSQLYNQNFDNLNFTKLSKNDLSQLYLFISLMEDLYFGTKWIWAPMIIGSNIGSFILDLLVSFVIIYFFTSLFYRIIPKEIRIKLVLYSLTPYIVSIFFYGCFGASLIYYIGDILAYIYASLAFKSIIRIEIRK